MINSLQNVQVKKVIALKKVKERKKMGLFTVEGIKMIEEIPKDWGIQKIFISQSFLKQQQEVLYKYKERVDIVEVADNVFKYMSDTQTPQGIMAVIKYKHYQLNEMLKKECPVIIVAEELQDPGNLGTIIRTADAAGADGIILSNNTVDLYNPKVVRATMGSLFHLPIVQNQDIIENINYLKEQGIQILAAHLKGKEYPYSINLKKGTAILIGNEGNGLSEEVSKLADKYIKLPMIGNAESLNVAVATAILMYEIVRQRLI